MHGGNRWTKSDKENKEFDRQKEEIIKLLHEDEYTLKSLSEITGMRPHNIASLIQNLKRIYDIDSRKGANKKIHYQIIRELEKDETAKTLYDVMPIWELPKVMYKSDLLSWHIQNEIYKVESSRQLVEIAKENGIKVYEYTPSGGHRYL